MISPDRLAALIAGWTHEAEVAEANQRADEYANTCRDTVEALRDLSMLRAAASELLLSMRQAYERGDKAILDRLEDALPRGNEE